MDEIFFCRLFQNFISGNKFGNGPEEKKRIKGKTISYDFKKEFYKIRIISNTLPLEGFPLVLSTNLKLNMLAYLYKTPSPYNSSIYNFLPYKTFKFNYNYIIGLLMYCRLTLWGLTFHFATTQVYHVQPWKISAKPNQQYVINQQKLSTLLALELITFDMVFFFS